ncbi:MAG: MFS transporter [Verrucomicrobiota bacterium]
MTLRQLKTGYYGLTALNTLASSYYINYLFFYLRDRFGFGDRENLWISALHGLLYALAAWQCGRFAQRHGFLNSLKLGFAGLTLAMVAGGLFVSIPGTVAALVGFTLVLLFTWPALEALVTANETFAGVSRMVGIYNCTWSAFAAIAYFTGGKLYDSLGAGAVFWVPGGIFFVQLLLTFWLAQKAALVKPPSTKPAATAPQPEAGIPHQAVGPKTFLKLAWVANPFAYVAVNTLFAVMPGLAQKLGLSPTRVGLFCSVWLFGRLAAFVLLWRWTGWHYRFRWLASGFVLLIVSFLAILLAHALWIVVFAQVFFGFATGLIYYSSLFYSMDVGEASAEHGGLHEAAIGLGIFAGTTVGAASLQFFPEHPNAGTVAVTVLLSLGLAALLFIWNRARRRHA